MNSNGGFSALLKFLLVVLIIAVLSLIFEVIRSEVVANERQDRILKASEEISNRFSRSVSILCSDTSGLDWQQCAFEQARFYKDLELNGLNLGAQQDTAQWARLAVLTGLLSTVIGAVGVYFVRQSLVQGQRGVDAAEAAISVTREIGQAQTRAYVSVTHKAEFREITPGKRHVMAMEISNSGQTPAYEVSFVASLFAANTDFVPDDKFWVEEDFEKKGQKMQLPSGIPSKVAGEIFLEEPVAMDILAGHANIFAACILVYQDVFGKRHETRVISSLAFVPLGSLDDNGIPVMTPVMRHIPGVNIHC